MDKQINSGMVTIVAPRLGSCISISLKF